MSEAHLLLHGTALSGHVHRVVLLLRALSIPYTFVEVSTDVQRTTEVRRLNPLGQIPVLQDGPLTIPDSNAILVYLAQRYAPGSGWLPSEPHAAAQVQRWLSIAAGELRHGPAAARAITLWHRPGDPARSRQIATQLFDFMEGHLTGSEYLAAAEPTLADLACHSYTAHTPEGGISLDPYPAIRRWLARIEGQPWFVPMPASPLPAAVLQGG